MKAILDKEYHVYTVDGIVKPSVSEIMRPLTEAFYEEADKYGRLERARQRGSGVHESIEIYLTFGIINEEYEKYVLAFINWMEQYKPNILRYEYCMTNGVYCGTVDLICEIDGKTHLIDYKATSVIHDNLLGIQLAAYEELASSEGFKIEETNVLHLKSSGTFIFKPIPINRGKWKELKKIYDQKQTD